MFFAKYRRGTVPVCMRGSLCPGLLQRVVWEAVSVMREAKSVGILQVHEVKSLMTQDGEGGKPTLEIANA